MVSPTNTLQYAPLDPDNNEIRLIQLLPATHRTKRIDCTLRIVSLKAKPRFEAISYAWGDESDTRPMTINGVAHAITANLHEALCRFRLKYRRRTLWADALCINQQDAAEKDLQIPLMGQIYSSASCVLVWLGPGNMFTSLSLAYVAAHCPLGPLSRFKTRLALLRRLWGFNDWKSLSLSSPSSARVFELLGAGFGFRGVLAEPFWSRLWTFQELMLAKMAVLYCGPMHVPLSESFIISLFEMQLRYVDTTHSSPFATRLHDDMLPMYLRAAEGLQVASTAVFDAGLQSIAGLLEDDIPSLADLLKSTVTRKCKEPCDRFYGLYGLVPALEAAVPVDSKRPVDHVQWDITVYLLTRDHGDNIWTYLPLASDQAGTERRGARGIPSWVPEFSSDSYPASLMHWAKSRLSQELLEEASMPRLRISNGIDRENKIWAGNDDVANRPIAAPVRGLTTVHLWARSIGSCRILHKFGATSDSVHAGLRSLLSSLKEESPLATTERSLGNGPSMPERRRLDDDCVMQCICMLGRYILDGTGLQLRDMVHCMLLVIGSESPSTTLQGRKGIAETVQALDRLIARPLMLVGDNHFFAIGSPGTRDGDVVVLAPEVPMPLCLMPKTRDSSIDTTVYYRLVGTFFIDGLMVSDGVPGRREALSAMPERVAWAASKPLVEFLIH